MKRRIQVDNAILFFIIVLTGLLASPGDIPGNPPGKHRVRRDFRCADKHDLPGRAGRFYRHLLVLLL
ncbi:MAG: hypothetical protein Q8Q08_06255 [Candidatus Omnitrophota bacterium]|nr:hypothetical protein [Candidatus Omnitrophota bacterium]